MDLGKFLADLRWWGHRHSVDLARLVQEFLDRYGPCDPARITRARLISVLSHLKLGTPNPRSRRGLGCAGNAPGQRGSRKPALRSTMIAALECLDVFSAAWLAERDPPWSIFPRRWLRLRPRSGTCTMSSGRRARDAGSRTRWKSTVPELRLSLPSTLIRGPGHSTTSAAIKLPGLAAAADSALVSERLGPVVEAGSCTVACSRSGIGRARGAFSMTSDRSQVPPSTTRRCSRRGLH